MRTTSSGFEANKTVEEGPVAKTIEHKTRYIPSDVFLWTALGCFGVAAAMQGAGRKHTGLLFSQLAPTFLLLGLYNKIVKVAGSDKVEASKPAFQP